MLALNFLGVAFDWAMHVGVEVTRIGPAGAFERICNAAHICSNAPAGPSYQKESRINSLDSRQNGLKQGTQYFLNRAKKPDHPW